MTAITSAYAHACQATCYQATCFTRHMSAVLMFPTFVPQHAKEAMISMDGPSFGTEILALWMVKPDCVRSLDLLVGELVFCLVLSSPPRLISLAQVPELTPATTLKWLLWSRLCFFSGLVVPVTRRFTMQHVYGYTGNLGNECADRALTLGALSFVSNHILATRWVRCNFDTSASVGSCNDICKVLKNYVQLGLKLRRCFVAGVSTVFFYWPADFKARIVSFVVCSQPFFLSNPFTMPCCTFTDPWKALPCSCLPLRVLMQVADKTSCGTLWWNCYFTCSLVVLSNISSMKLT